MDAMQMLRDEAKESQCLRRRVAAMYVTPKGAVTLGHNRLASEITCRQGGCPRGQLSPFDVEPGSSYSNCKAVHAEEAAVMASGYRPGGKLVVTDTPCYKCQEMIDRLQIEVLVVRSLTSSKELEVGLFIGSDEHEHSKMYCSNPGCRVVVYNYGTTGRCPNCLSENRSERDTRPLYDQGADK